MFVGILGGDKGHGVGKTGRETDMKECFVKWERCVEGERVLVSEVEHQDEWGEGTGLWCTGDVYIRCMCWAVYWGELIVQIGLIKGIIAGVKG